MQNYSDKDINLFLEATETYKNVLAELVNHNAITKGLCMCGTNVDAVENGMAIIRQLLREKKNLFRAQNTQYTLGQHDAMALVLMQAKMNWGLKLPDLAKEYHERFGEHPTLEFHNQA